MHFDDPEQAAKYSNLVDEVIQQLVRIERARLAIQELKQIAKKGLGVSASSFNESVRQSLGREP